MIESLNTLDTNILLFLNGLYNDYFNEFMWIVSRSYTWVLIVITLLYVTIKKDRRQAIAVVLGIVLVICFADQISSGLIKPIVQRFRPTHEPALDGLVHVVNGYKGGIYGFVSSHASNSFGVALFLAMVFKRRIFSISIFTWAVILSYSRIYMGVHYPGDILCGGVIGMVCGYLVYLMYKWAIIHFLPLSGITLNSFGKNETRLMVGAILLTYMVIAIVSIFLC